MRASAAEKSRKLRLRTRISIALIVALAVISAFQTAAYAYITFLAFATSLGGNGNDQGHAIAVDASGNVYTTGFFKSTADFDPGPDTASFTSAGNADIYVCKMDPAGNLVWARAFGEVNGDIGYGIATGILGRVYVTGSFQGTVDFGPGFGVTTLTATGGGANDDDIFVLALTRSGNLAWVKGLGGIDHENAWDITSDASGNVYVTGQFGGTADFDPGPGTANLTSAGNMDIFVCKLDSAGSFVWAKAMGGVQREEGGSGIAVDGSGNVYTTGSFIGTADFDPGPGVANLTSAGGTGSSARREIYVSKLDAAGNYVWAKAMGGTFSDEGASIAVDPSGNVYTTGYFDSAADFDPGPNVTTLTGIRESIFVSKLDSAGNFVWAKAMDGNSGSSGMDIAVDESGNVFTTGYFFATVDLDPGVGTAFHTSAGHRDIFVSKLSSAGIFAWAHSMGSDTADEGTSITVDASGKVYTTGFYAETVDFNPEYPGANITSAGGDDIFVVKLQTHDTLPTNNTWGILLLSLGSVIAAFAILGRNAKVRSKGD